MVKVGILTEGKPRIVGNRILNALMGDGFHWQRCFALSLPKEAAVICTEPLIVEMPVEAYLRCVVGSEMNPLAPIEFLRAHAIVSRSWMMGKIMRIHAEGTEGGLDSQEEIRIWADTGSHSLFHVCNDDHCQRFQGEQPLADSLRDALESTRSLVLTDADGKLVDARFSKCCGGRTEIFSTCWQDVDYPCLRSVEDPWCAPEMLTPAQLNAALKDYDAETTPHYYLWDESVEAADIAERLRVRFNRSVGEVTALKPLHRGPSGRIDRLCVEGTEGSFILGKELAIRRLLSQTHLYSSNFTVERSGTRFLLHGRGWGHGVGLCQIGAAAMAFHGKTAEQILAHYYPGSRVKALRSLRNLRSLRRLRLKIR